ncbi:hypothetical protein GCM10010967_33120 [Dyadobacter beijingensis]|uniref:Short chain dehydrogenase n=1 Tax=Dyadobacter beijingensis TaxID=365489 RepID=A0ABQ2I0A6_9BACT|nr:SDR family NAD(P)-dependent oxidoreductase [Dyadobacter beijingensis]GGM96779.1 hypothetical protein GCM10010967_33120 [Dyadobacter beijingensis]
MVFTGRNAKANEEAEQSLGNQAHGIVSDAAKLEDIQRLKAQVKAVAPKVDILFLNAGIARFSPLDQVTAGFYDQIFDVNFKGAYLTIQALLLLVNDGGSIILNTSSNAHFGRGIQAGR